MRKSLFLLFILFATISVNAQDTKQVLNFDGIEELKLGMTKADLEKLLKKKIVFKHIGIDEIYTESLDVTYKGIPFELGMMRSEEYGARLESVATTNPRYKTAEGIGIGSTELEIINAYENDLLMISRDQVTLAGIDDIRSSIVFTMKNKKVVKISVEPTAAFRDRE